MKLSHMTETIATLAKSLIAMVTFVRFLFGVDSEMFLEGASIAKFSLTIVASVWFFAGMNPFMSGKG